MKTDGFKWQMTEKGLEITLNFGHKQPLGEFGAVLDILGLFFDKDYDGAKEFFWLINSARLTGRPMEEVFHEIYGEDADFKSPILIRPKRQKMMK